MKVDFEDMAEDLYNISSAFALEILGTRSKNEDKSKSWLNEEKKFKARKTFLNWLNKRYDVSLKIYKSKRKDIFSEIRRFKNEDWGKACVSINCQLGFKKAPEAWNILKGVRTDTQYKTNFK